MPRGGLYLFLGPDRLRKLTRLHELERALKIEPLDRHQLDATVSTGAAFLALCRQRPAASPVRLIVMDQAQRLDAASVNGLVEHAEVIVKNACVVLLVEGELSARHALAKVQQRSGAGSSAAGKLFMTERFPGRSAPPTKPFALTDALGRQDVAGALVAVREQLSAGKAPLELISLVAWQLHRWMTVKRLGSAGYSAERMVSVTGMHSWQVQRLQSEVARRSLESLQQTLSRCWQLDVDAKRGRTIPELALEQMVAEICQPASAEGAVMRRA